MHLLVHCIGNFVVHHLGGAAGEIFYDVVVVVTVTMSDHHKSVFKCVSYEKKV
jgi:hypothetical protein